MQKISERCGWYVVAQADSLALHVEKINDKINRLFKIVEILASAEA